MLRWNNISQRDKFKFQLSLINSAMCTTNCVLLGDFNLNYAGKNDVNYSHIKYFDDFDDALLDKNLIQIVEFPTWSRIVNNVLIESIIDHIYVKDPTILSQLSRCLGSTCLF